MTKSAVSLMENFVFCAVYIDQCSTRTEIAQFGKSEKNAYFLSAGGLMKSIQNSFEIAFLTR